jgi:hypothetical protein
VCDLDRFLALVLATEGAETQGYQKKQAKNETLIKYMQHGGVNTFTFHGWYFLLYSFAATHFDRSPVMV